jgi:hypothetical protein
MMHATRAWHYFFPRISYLHVTFFFARHFCLFSVRAFELFGEQGIRPEMIDLPQRIYTSLRTRKFCTHQESFAFFASQTCQHSTLYQYKPGPAHEGTLLKESSNYANTLQALNELRVDDFFGDESVRQWPRE